MPKPPLFEDQAVLETQMIETALAGLKLYRPDLHYPESHSDMQACVRALLIAFEIRRRPLPDPLKLVCNDCEGIGHIIMASEQGYKEMKTCSSCSGRGYTLGN